MIRTKRLWSLWGFFVFLLLSNTDLGAQGVTNCFRVTPERIPAIVDSIQHNFGSKVTLIPNAAIADFLTHELDRYPLLSPSLEPPLPHISGYSPTRLLLRWPQPGIEPIDYFEGSVLDLQELASPTVLPTITELGVMVELKPNLFHHLQLISFFSVKNNAQSVLHIIIIDKDATIRCEQEVISAGSLPEAKLANASEVSFQVAPNPSSDWTQFHFFLEKDGEVSIRVYDLISGKQVATPLQPTLLSKGNHQIVGDWQAMPTGHYACVLSCNGQAHTRRLVKVSP